MKNQEIEIRALAKNNEDIETLRRKIIDSGTISKAIVSIRDIYYCDKSCTKVEDAEMNKVGSYSVRVRKEIKNEVTKITYNKKIITTEGDHHAWREEEEPRDSFEEADQEMLNNGYKFFFELDKNRETFTFDDMEIYLEDIKDFGLGI